jgi:putative hydrolase of the HAD superfamily
MKPLQALFFDLDDTLIDDDGSYRRSIELSCADLAGLYLGLDPVSLVRVYDEQSRAYWSQLVHTGLENLAAIRFAVWQRALERCGCADNVVVAQACELYARHRVDTATAFPDAEALLAELHHKMPMALITNGPGDGQREKLRVTGLDRYFDVIVCSGEHGVGKPEPAIFAVALDKLGVTGAAVWHVGDRMESDIAGAKASGLTAVWVNRTGVGRGPDDPAPDHEINSLAELPGLIE